MLSRRQLSVVLGTLVFASSLAKALGITIPQWVLLQADRVIQ